jgi:hypothetical protein
MLKGTGVAAIYGPGNNIPEAAREVLRIAGTVYLFPGSNRRRSLTGKAAIRQQNTQFRLFTL